MAAELLTQASRLVMLDVVRIIFQRLPGLPPSIAPPESAALHPSRGGFPHIQAGNLTMQREVSSEGSPQLQSADGVVVAHSNSAESGGGVTGEGEPLLSTEPGNGDAAAMEGLPPLGMQHCLGIGAAEGSSVCATVLRRTAL